MSEFTERIMDYVREFKEEYVAKKIECIPGETCHIDDPKCPYYKNGICRDNPKSDSSEDQLF